MAARAPTSLFERATLRQIIPLVALAAAIPTVKYWLDSFAIASWPMETSGFPVARDFANIWSAGGVAWTGEWARLFSAEQHMAGMGVSIHPSLAAAGPILVWSYPPTGLWLGLPFSALPYTIAVVAWLLFGLAAASGAVASNGWRAAIVLLLAAPGTWICLFYGQTALLTAAVLVGGLRLSASRPILAAALLATLVAKPHLGIAVPLYLAATRNWRCFLATGLFAALYLVVTLIAFGLEPWRLFLSVTLPQQAAFYEKFFFVVPEMVISFVALFRRLGAEVGTAVMLHGALAIGVAGLAYRGMHTAKSEAQRITIAVVATLLISPYMQLYELAIIGVLAAWIATDDATADDASLVPLKGLLALLLLAPIVILLFASRTGFNPAPVLLGGVLLGLVWIGGRSHNGTRAGRMDLIHA
jgi:hypothetical protein